MRRCDCGEHVPGRRLSREPGASGSPDSPDAHHIVCGQETLEYVCPLQREYHSTQHIHNSNDNDNRWDTILRGFPVDSSLSTLGCPWETVVLP